MAAETVVVIQDVYINYCLNSLAMPLCPLKILKILQIRFHTLSV